MKSWTFGQKLASGFALAIVLACAIGTNSYRSLRVVLESRHAVIHTHDVLEHIELVLSLAKDAETGQRGFVITGQEPYLAPYENASRSSSDALQTLRRLTIDNPHQTQRVDEMRPLLEAKYAELARTVAVRREQGFAATAAVVGTGEGRELMVQIRRLAGEMQAEERDLLQRRTVETEATSRRALQTILVGTALSALALTLFGWFLVSTLSRQLGAAVQHVQSSSTELQTTANQQAVGAREQATAMTEITTTISELLATSRQIAESAQRVAHIAEETAKAARGGDQTMLRTQEALTGIRRQVDLIVSHMLDLGKKSQQIGGILEIINELSEQTNILAINATIEAVGAGESGRRFAVVADEIRKLADRVGGSTKEIRGLIDEVRAAVNTTVMATESGSKAVDAGGQRFAEVAVSLKQIVDLVATTTEAAREIELSTKQQATAVEQVNIAIANVAQATRENEVGSNQTLDTASQLNHLSRDLTRLIQPGEGA